MSEVVLIIPKYEMRNIMTAKRESIDKPIVNLQLYPSLGIAYLASCLQKNDLTTTIIDISANYFTQKDVIKVLKKEKPQIIGIYVNSFSLHSTHLLIKKIRKNIKTKIIVGGNHITHDPSAVLSLGADYGFRGEAEAAFPSIVKAVKEGKEPKKIRGLVKIKNKKIVSNGIASIKNLDSVPFPAKHLLPNEKYYTPFFEGKATTMFTSRGCIFNCIFCSSRTKKIAVRSPENVVKEMEYLVHKGFDTLLIEDDLFTFNQKRIKKICKLIIKKGIKIRWGCTTRADLINLNLLKLMKKAGCSLISFGIESGDEDIRNKVIGKQVSNKRIVTAFRNARKAKIKTLAFCMFGHPGETLNDMKKTLRFVIEVNPDYVDFSLSTILPKSKLFDIAIKEKKIDKNVWSGIIKDNELIPVYIPDGFVLEKLKKMQKKAFLTFYFRPKKVLQELKNTNSVNNLLFKFKLIFKLLRYFKN